MKLKLKEDPHEWQKFTLVMALVLGAISVALRLREVLPQKALVFVLSALAFGVFLCWLRPRSFRGFYRGGTTVSFHIGQVAGKILLTIFFLLVLTPLGLLLRLAGKDLQNVKRKSAATTYWQPANNSSHFDQQF